MFGGSPNMLYLFPASRLHSPELSAQQIGPILSRAL